MILKGVVSPDTNPPVSVAAPPSDVTGLVANVVSQQVILTWNVSTAAVGHSIAYYRVQRKKSTDSIWGDPTVGYIPSGTNGYTDTGATPGFTWNYRVYAYQDDGQASATPATANAVVPSTPGADVLAPIFNSTPALNSATGITDNSFTITCVLATDPTPGGFVSTGTHVYRMRQDGVEKATYHHPLVVIADRIVTVTNGSGATPAALTDSGSLLTGGGFNIYGAVDKFSAKSQQIQGGFTRSMTLTSFTGTDKGGIHLRSGLDPSAPMATIGVYYSGSVAYFTFEYRVTQAGQAAQFSAVPVTFPFTVEATWAPETNTVSARYKIGAGSWNTTDNLGATLAKQIVLGTNVECMKLVVNEQTEATSNTATLGYSADTVTLATVATFVGSGNQPGSTTAVTVTTEDAATPPNVGTVSNTVNVTYTGGGGGGGGGQTSTKDNPAFPRIALLVANHRLDEQAAPAIVARYANFHQGVYNLVPGTTSDLNASITGVKAINSNFVALGYGIPTTCYPSGSPNLSVQWQKLDAMNWWLRDGWPSGPIIDDAYPGQKVVNNSIYTNADGSGDRWPQWYVKNYWKALFFDVVAGLDGPWEDGGHVINPNGGSWLQSGFNDNDKDNYFALVNTLFRDARVALFNAMATNLPGKYRHANIAQWGHPAYSGITDYNGLIHGGLVEQLMVATQGVGQNAAGWNWMMDYYRRAKARLASPQHVWFHCSQYAADDYANMRYGLASCLLDDGFFVYDSHNDVFNDWYGSALLFDEYIGGNRGREWLGFPTSSPPLSAWQNTIYRRDYQNGIALVCPEGSGSRNFTLEGTFYRLNGSQDPTVNNGQAITSGTLADGTGLLLARAP